MAFDNADYKAGLDAVNAATNRLSTEVGELKTAAQGVSQRMLAIADKLASRPSDAEIAKAAEDLKAHAATLGAVGDSLDEVEGVLDGIAANPEEPAPVTEPITPVEPPA